MKPTPGTVWEAGGFRLNIGRGRADTDAIYCLVQFLNGPYRNPSWERVDYSARSRLSEIVRDYPDVPGLADLLGVLPENPALASKRYWRHLADEREPSAALEPSLLPEVARYRALEAAALLEAGCMK